MRLQNTGIRNLMLLCAVTTIETACSSGDENQGKDAGADTGGATNADSDADADSATNTDRGTGIEVLDATFEVAVHLASDEDPSGSTQCRTETTRYSSSTAKGKSSYG